MPIIAYGKQLLTEKVIYSNKNLLRKSIFRILCDPFVLFNFTFDDMVYAQKRQLEYFLLLNDLEL